MKYKVIFSSGNFDDSEMIMIGIKYDVLILDEKGNYFNPQFIALDRINGVFVKNEICFLLEDLVILHTVSRENILKSISELHSWRFTERWLPVNESILVEHFYPIENWLIIEVDV